MKKITKAIIPAAGYGTRFLPSSKAIPKEMLPIVDVPTIEYIVDEATKSGIEEIFIIISLRKEAIRNHFIPDKKLETILSAKNKTSELNALAKINTYPKITFIYQKEATGLGAAILLAKDYIKNEPFAILLGDDLVFNKVSQKPALRQCIDAYYKMCSSILGVQKVEVESVSKYGIVDPKNKNQQLSEILNIIEKPDIANAPSKLAVLGRYVLTPGIFPILETIEVGIGNEIQLTDAIFKLMINEKVYFQIFEGTRYDIGNKIGFLQANVEYGLRDETISDNFKKYLLKLGLKNKFVK